MWKVRTYSPPGAPPPSYDCEDETQDFRRDPPFTWLDSYAEAQFLCDQLNIRDYGKVDP